eukprot:NODE_87_length_21893_cov_0.496559.p11 type:complete len:262 gc:universal NODE_87_length_21893_cov_0.496559:12715-11930(-)
MLHLFSLLLFGSSEIFSNISIEQLESRNTIMNYVKDLYDKYSQKESLKFNVNSYFIWVKTFDECIFNKLDDKYGDSPMIAMVSMYLASKCDNLNDEASLPEWHQFAVSNSKNAISLEAFKKMSFEIINITSSSLIQASPLFFMKIFANYYLELSVLSQSNSEKVIENRDGAIKLFENQAYDLSLYYSDKASVIALSLLIAYREIRNSEDENLEFPIWESMIQKFKFTSNDCTSAHRVIRYIMYLKGKSFQPDRLKFPLNRK